jgi:hypothetical protein
MLAIPIPLNAYGMRRPFPSTLERAHAGRATL